jgi:CheY-like chemotaxis protein
VHGKNPILIAEDDPTSGELVQLALERAGVTNPTHIVPNGTQVIAYLQAEGAYADRQRFPFPRLLLLDLKMPVMDGFQVLEWLGAHPDCSIIPTVIMSASSIDKDVRRAYQMGASSYMVKPLQFEQFVKMFRILCEYWETCALPEMPLKC